MTDLYPAQEPAHLGHHIVGCPAGFLLYDEDPLGNGSFLGHVC